MRVFLKNIINGYRSGAFDGKEGIWSFMKDIAQNLKGLLGAIDIVLGPKL